MIKAGQVIGQFKILEKLGSGGMGDVFLAEDMKLGRNVALKFLSADFFTDSERLSRFQREAKTAAKISHPNVTAIYDLGTFQAPDSSEESLYIVMEHVSGESLKGRLANNKTDLPEILRLAEKIAAGLSAAHKLGIVHRDIKADNILINEDGEPKILDFGLAKFTEAPTLQDSNRPNDNIDDEDGDTISRELTQAGKIVGTVTYMSPEQARGEDIGTRSDIFSFGALLYRMSTGEFPFTGPTQVSTLAKILEVTQDPPSTKNDAIPPELERIITKCLQKQPGDRYQNTRDLVLDLRSLRKQFDSGITDSSSSISSPSMSKSEAPSTKSYLRPILIVATIAAVAASIVMILYFPSNQVGSSSSSQIVAAENSIAILDFANKTNDSELQWLESGLPEILLTDLTENRALNVVGRGRILDYIRAKSNSSAENATAEEMRSACKKVGAASIISGSFYKMGDKIRIDARLEETSTGNVIWSQKVIGEDLFTLVDSLTDKIAVSLNVDDLAPTDQQVTKVMTSSPEAYRLYLEGVDQMLSDRHKEALVSFDKALAIDSAFGMVYMRIGITHVFSGHHQLGLEYLRKAKTFANNFPVKSKSLLDIYVDIFVHANFTDGFAKMESYISNYPDDKEARTIYGALLDIAQSDTVAVYSQFDTVLTQDPTYQFALSMYANMLSQHNQYEHANELLEKLLKFHAESPEPYEALIKLYFYQNKIEQAIDMCQKMIALFPNNEIPLRTLVDLYISKREFDSASHYNERFNNTIENDHFSSIRYYRNQANLYSWQGEFKPALKAIHTRLKESRLADDSVQISNSLLSLGSVFQRLNKIDSALYYTRLSYTYNSRIFSASSYPLDIITADHAQGVKLKPLFDSLMTVFRAQLPQGAWLLADGVKGFYEGEYDNDTLKIIDGLKLLTSTPKFTSGENLRALASYQMEYGQYQEALETLEQVMSGKFESTSGFSAPMTLYTFGRAHEGLGHNNQAAKAYQEMLSYWGNADIQFKEITDAKERLARLTS